MGLVFQRFSSTLIEEVVAEPWMQLLRGVILMIVLPIASVVLLGTLFGIPLGLLGLVSFAAIIIFGSIMAPIVLGSIVSSWVFKTHVRTVNWKTILLGAVLYALLALVPFIGWLAKLIVFLLTVGAMLKIKWRVVQEWR